MLIKYTTDMANAYTNKISDTRPGGSMSQTLLKYFRMVSFLYNLIENAILIK